jgi:hypothetical protein
LYAAAIGGEPGVLHAIDILATEIDRNMGCSASTAWPRWGPERVRRVAMRSLRASEKNVLGILERSFANA